MKHLFPFFGWCHREKDHQTSRTRSDRRWRTSPLCHTGHHRWGGHHLGFRDLFFWMVKCGEWILMIIENPSIHQSNQWVRAWASESVIIENGGFSSVCFFLSADVWFGILWESWSRWVDHLATWKLQPDTGGFPYSDPAIPYLHVGCGSDGIAMSHPNKRFMTFMKHISTTQCQPMPLELFNVPL
jgi:hypothetical protein